MKIIVHYNLTVMHLFIVRHLPDDAEPESGGRLCIRPLPGDPDAIWRRDCWRYCILWYVGPLHRLLDCQGMVDILFKTALSLSLSLSVLLASRFILVFSVSKIFM